MSSTRAPRNVSTHIPLVARMPRGGSKHSGCGNDPAMDGFEDHSRSRPVMAVHDS